MSKTKGRPEKYSDKFLLDLLIKIAVEYPGKLNPNLLERESAKHVNGGIKRHVWIRRMTEHISRVNAPNYADYGGEDGMLALPNILELASRYFNNKEKLLKVLENYDDISQGLYEKAKKYEEDSRNYQKLKGVLEQKEALIKELKSEAEYYKNLYFTGVVKSTFQHFRSEEGLKSNIVSIDKKKATDMVNFKQMYPELFGDEGNLENGDN